MRFPTLKFLSSNQIPSSLACLGLGVGTSMYEKISNTFCSVAVKNRTCNNIGSLLFNKTSEFGISFFLKRINSDSLSQKTVNSIAAFIITCSVINIGLNIKNIVEDTSTVFELYQDQPNDFCAGYMISSLLASITKIQISTSLTLKGLSMIKNENTSRLPISI